MRWLAVAILTAVVALPAPQAFGSVMLLSDVPSYSWYHGCGPTAAASVLGYWDLHGYTNMFTADRSN